MPGSSKKDEDDETTRSESDVEGKGGEKKAKKKSGSKNTKPSKKKSSKNNLLNNLATKLLSKIPTTKKKEKDPNKTKEELPTVESPTKDGVEIPKPVKDYLTAILDVEKSQTLKKYYANTLNKIVPPASCTAFADNIFKNQSPDVFCNDATRVKLAGAANVPGSDYIHANFVKFAGLKRTYIATQHPLKNTVEDFYAMIFAQEVDTVLSLSPSTDFFPTEKDGFINLPKFSISCKFVKPETKYSPAEYTLDVLPNGCSNSALVRLLKYRHWGKGQVPASPKVINSLIKACKPCRGPLVVQCETGINQSAAFIFIDATLGILDAGGTPTMETVFRELRTQRCGALYKRYHFLHSVYTLLYLLRNRAARAGQAWEGMKSVELLEKMLTAEFAKYTSSETNLQKKTSETVDQSIE